MLFTHLNLTIPRRIKTQHITAKTLLPLVWMNSSYKHIKEHSCVYAMPSAFGSLVICRLYQSCKKIFNALRYTHTHTSHRSHFGSRYKLGCCGHAGLLQASPYTNRAIPLKCDMQTDRKRMKMWVYNAERYFRRVVTCGGIQSQKKPVRVFRLCLPRLSLLLLRLCVVQDEVSDPCRSFSPS